MKQLLYIGHSFHNKTRSTQFLQDMFKTKYDVTVFDFDPYNDSFEVFKKINNNFFDIVVLFQIMPPISKLKQYISFDKISFFPMYDGVPGIKDPIWKEYKDCNIIHFSKTLHLRCKKHGFSSFYIQYFPKPKDNFEYGDEKSVFLWQRINYITSDTIEKTLDTDKLNTIYLHQVPDPCNHIAQPSDAIKDKVKVSTWFETREEMEELLQQSAIYYSPRVYEGIGMSFLGAMAMGRCVIAPNNPTMNEYIKNGKNGYLYNVDTPKKIVIKDVRKIQRNAYNFIKKGYIEWERTKHNILFWLELNPKDNFNQKLFDKKYNRKPSFLDKIGSFIFKKIKDGNRREIIILGFLKIKYRKKRK